MPAYAVVLIGIGIGFILGLGGFWTLAFFRSKKTRRQAKTIIIEAEAEATRIKKEALLSSREEIYKLKSDFERTTKETRYELKSLERRILKREDALDRKADSLQRRERYLDGLEKSAADKKQEWESKNKEIEQLLLTEKKTLSNIAGLSREEATKLLLDKLESELHNEMAALINKTRTQAEETAEAEANKIIALAIQRYAANYTPESTVSTIDLPSDDMKGRIIGREGRNIRAFEKATGLDVVVDDTPGVVVVSGFDGVRREIGRRALEKLIADGRIHPGRIEEIVEQTKKEVIAQLEKIGKEVCFDLQIHGLHIKLVGLLGRLKYRTSYGQNVLQHSVEVAYLCSLLASELGFDTQLAKRCGLLHDIGKAVDHEIEGTHPEIGADLVRRCGERPEIIDAAEHHHDNMNPEFIYTVLTSAADAISASRPGARRETLEKYIQRLERLEAIANAYPGIENTFAIQAGREVRVLVNAQQVDDAQATVIARNIVKDIEQELKYPGKIRVTVIRETRVIEYAK